MARKKAKQSHKNKGLLGNRRTRVVFATALLGWAGQAVLNHFEQTTAGLIVAISLGMVAIIILLYDKRIFEPLKNRMNVIILLIAIAEIGTTVSFYAWIQAERNAHHPTLAVVSTMVGRVVDENNRVNFQVQINMMNKGDMAAYKFKFTRVIAPLGKLQDVQVLPIFVSGGNVGTGEQIMIPTTFSIPSVDGSVQTVDGIALYWDVQYTDKNGRLFHNEQRAVIYPNEGRLAYMNQDVEDVFDVFVLRALGKPVR